MNAVAPAEKSSDRSAYVFPNAEGAAEERLQVLAQIFDPVSRECLDRVGIAAGWSCWEVGAGHGTIARWMHDRVGEDGRVLATDLDPRFVRPLASSSLEVLQHDVVRDAPPSQAFDLIHARLLLCHLTEREEVLDRMIMALKPGGWLVLEDFDALSLLPDPETNPVEVLLKSGTAAREWMRRVGVDLRLGRLLAGKLRGRGLTEIYAEGRLFMCQDGSLLTRFQCLTFEQIGKQLIASGLLSTDELTQDMLALRENYMAPSPILWSVAGRRPFT